MYEFPNFFPIFNLFSNLLLTALGHGASREKRGSEGVIIIPFKPYPVSLAASHVEINCRIGSGSFIIRITELFMLLVDYINYILNFLYLLYLYLKFSHSLHSYRRDDG